MISLNTLTIKNYLNSININKYQKEIESISNDISKLKTYSSILEIISMTKTNKTTDNSNVLLFIKAYENICLSNDFSFCKCPNCKHDNTLKYHKTYQRNIILDFAGYEINSIITLIVLECSFCKQIPNCQHFHALLPDFIFPYHIYSSHIILDSLIDCFINNLKVSAILEQRRLSHQLFYRWIHGIQKYSISSSIILKTKNELVDILDGIKNNRYLFLHQFYQQYFHPFFLFKSTCVPLCIIP